MKTAATGRIRPPDEENFVDFVEKRKGQQWLQTWHLTGIMISSNPSQSDSAVWAKAHTDRQDCGGGINSAPALCMSSVHIWTPFFMTLARDNVELGFFFNIKRPNILNLLIQTVLTTAASDLSRKIRWGRNRKSSSRYPLDRPTVSASLLCQQRLETLRQITTRVWTPTFSTETATRCF